MRSRRSSRTLVLRRQMRSGSYGSHGTLDQKDFLNTVAVQRLPLTVNLNHNRLQGHGQHTGRENRAVAKFDGVVSESAERDGNAAARGLVRSHFQWRGAECKTFLPQFQLVCPDSDIDFCGS